LRPTTRMDFVSGRASAAQVVGVSFIHLIRIAAGICLVAGMCARNASAQAYPLGEGYMGFSLYNNEYGTIRHNSPGLQFDLGYNAARYLRLVGDFGAQFHSTPIVWTNGKKAEADSYQILFGPELRMRNRTRLTPFVHGLAGLAVRSYVVPTGNWICSGSLLLDCYQETFSAAREVGFAWAGGGGLEWSVHPNISVRLIQFDFVRTKLSRDNLSFSPAALGQFPTLNGWQDNYRFSFGITFRFGEKGEAQPRYRAR
jgi:Outer membrane protein beta-barrel domain